MTHTGKTLIETDLPLEKKQLTDVMAFVEPDILLVGYSESVLETDHFKLGMFDRIDVFDVMFPDREDLKKVNIFTVFDKSYSTIIIDVKKIKTLNQFFISNLIKRSSAQADICLHGCPDDRVLTSFLDRSDLTLKSFVSNVEGDFVATFRHDK